MGKESTSLLTKYLAGLVIFCSSASVFAATASKTTTHTVAHPKKKPHIEREIIVERQVQPMTLDKIKGYLQNRNPKIIGYLQVDYAHYVSNPTRLGDGEEIRRAYLGVVGDVTPDWGYTLVVDFARNAVHIKDAWLIYSGFRPTTIRIGNMKEPLSLEHLESDVNLTFLERALPVTAFFPDRRIGVNVDTYGQFSEHNSYTIGAGVFGVDVGHPRTHESDEGWSLDARFTYAFQPCVDKLLHIGAWETGRRPDSNKLVNFNNKPESDITDVTFVNTGIMKEVTFYEIYGFELAGVYSIFSLQGEYIGAHLNRQDDYVKGVLVHNSNLNFKGWYGYASLFLTGESRTYDKTKGIFTGIKPIHDYGAWEVALRYSDLNLTDHTVIGGQEHNITFGLNWYVNDYVRFMADYIKVLANRNGLHNTPSVYTLRAQINFS